MNRRGLLGLIGLSPLALVSFKMPTTSLAAIGMANPLVANMIKRWEKCKALDL